MSREIRFRAWDNQKKKMYYDVQNVSGMNELEGFACFDRILNAPMENEYGEIDGTRRFEVMRYAGFPDENKRDIYEGDICSFFDNVYSSNLVGIVKFGKYEQDGSGDEYPPTPVIGFFVEIIKWKYTEDSFYDDEEYPEWNRKISVLKAMNGKTYEKFEVIGNVFDNMELLEVEK